MVAQLYPLQIPDGVHHEEDAHELVRFWISGGSDHVSLNMGLFDTDKEPTIWGSIIADIAKHAVNGMMQDDPTRDKDAVFSEIERAFAERLKETVNYTGKLRPKRQ